MLKNDLEKETKINQILNIVKIASVSFPAIAYLQYFSLNFDTLDLFVKSGLLLTSVLSVILIIYVLWSFLQSKLSDKLWIKKWIDPIISLSFAFTSVMLTGSYQSNYKFLFLLVIISSSIECSKRESLFISGLSATIVLAIDLIFAPNASVNTLFESDIVLVCVFMIISWTIGYYVDLRKKHIESLKEQNNIDGLTELYNHRHFYDYLETQLSISKENRTDLSLLFIDLDNFKIYNDICGHQMGDEVLRIIAKIMRELMPENAFIARYGGEEFAVLLPEIGEVQAMQNAEKLRIAIQEWPFSGEQNLPGGNVTISVGVSTFPLKAKNATELLKKADEACYRAKFLYKNRVEAYYSILEEHQNNANESDNEAIASIKTLIAVINAKDKYTYGHVERVAYYCTLIAEKMGISEKDKKALVCSAYLHDIGKINISEDILMKTETLNAEEWKIIKDHPKKSFDIIKNVSLLRDMAPIVLQHHERYDGTGYPFGLKGEGINYLARILSVVDSFDAMTSVRPYQVKKTYDQAIKELIKYSGTQFDPEIVTEFINAVQQKI